MIRYRKLCIGLSVLALVAALGVYTGASADDLGDLDDYADETWDVIEDETIKGLMDLDDIAPFEDLAPLWDYQNAGLQRQVEEALESLGLMGAAKQGQLAVTLVDITRLEYPRTATVNGDKMMYAASLPKIAVLLAAFEKIAQGRMELDAATEASLKRMIRVSSNTAATQMMHQVGKEYIARVLLSPRYRLYDPKHNGGLWVGKDYGKSGLWRRDPLHNLSHGATAMQVARFYYLLATENLVTPEYSRKMKTILQDTGLEHKFVRALRRIDPQASLSRKSGSWSTFHSDSVIVERDGRAYIAVVLSNNPKGSRWLGQIITALHRIMFPPAVATAPASTP